MFDWFEKNKSFIASITIVGMGVIAIWTVTFAAIMIIEALDATDSVKVILCVGVVAIQFLLIQHITKTVRMIRRHFAPKVDKELDIQWINLREYDELNQKLKKLDEKIKSETLKLAELEKERDKLKEQMKASEKK